MPMLAFVMAVGMAFANKANVQTDGWINLNGVATQLENNDPCIPGNETCRVTFQDDEQEREFTVYESPALETPKQSVSDDAYELPEMPE